MPRNKIPVKDIKSFTCKPKKENLNHLRRNILKRANEEERSVSYIIETILLKEFNPKP